MGAIYAERSKFHVGDAVSCLTTMTALPIHIDKIHKIDYNFGELAVSGYGIIFIDSPLTVIPSDIQPDYTMVAFDEAANLYNIYAESKKGMRYLLIGKDLLSSIIYVSSIKKAVGNSCYITVVLDEDGIGTLSCEQVTEELAYWADSSYIIDVTQPISSVERILDSEELYDMTINGEDLPGAEVLSVILTRHKGKLYFTSLKNNISQSNLIAESMGKELDSYVLNQYVAGVEEQFIFELLSSSSEELERLASLYRKQASLFSSGTKKEPLLPLKKRERQTTSYSAVQLRRL